MTVKWVYSSLRMETDLGQRTDSFLFITRIAYRILLLQGFDYLP
jgi:hypothetical protein